MSRSKFLQSLNGLRVWVWVQSRQFFLMNTHKCKARLLNFNHGSLPCDVANSSRFWNFTGSKNQYHTVGVQERERWHLFSDQQSNSAIETFKKLGYSLQNLITIGKKNRLTTIFLAITYFLMANHINSFQLLFMKKN